MREKGNNGTHAADSDVQLVSADGYFAGPDGTLEWVVPDEEQAKAAAKSIPGFDTVLFGRRTYELFEELPSGDVMLRYARAN